MLNQVTRDGVMRGDPRRVWLWTYSTEYGVGGRILQQKQREKEKKKKKASYIEVGAVKVGTANTNPQIRGRIDGPLSLHSAVRNSAIVTLIRPQVDMLDMKSLVDCVLCGWL